MGLEDDCYLHRRAPLAIPHYVVLFSLWIGAVLAAIAAWFSILFGGRYPPGIFDYVEAALRWHNRVVALRLLLLTDDDPPFPAAPVNPCSRSGGPPPSSSDRHATRGWEK
ncbi:MAG: DUF4389 domain-containing protein [Actinobacteria bacterium]|nr:DUF4389 domain-containing protein [Actinomycetota bacterium]